MYYNVYYMYTYNATLQCILNELKMMVEAFHIPEGFQIYAYTQKKPSLQRLFSSKHETITI